MGRWPRNGRGARCDSIHTEARRGRPGSPGPSCTLSLLPATQGTKEATLRSCDLMLLMAAEKTNAPLGGFEHSHWETDASLICRADCWSGFPGGWNGRQVLPQILMQHLLTMAVPGWKGPGFERRHKPEDFTCFISSKIWFNVASLMVQVFRLCLPIQAVRIQSWLGS